MDTVASDPPLSPRRSSRRLWRLVALLFATPALLVGGLLGYVWLREHSWTPPAIVEPSPLPDGYARRVAAARRFDEDPYTKAVSYRSDRPDDPADDPLLPLMRETAAKNRQALADLRAALAAPCWVPAARPGQDPPGLANGVAMRRTARVLAMLVRLRQAEGDHPAAIAAGLDGIQLGLDLGRGRDTISLSVGVVVASVQARALWALLPVLNASEARAMARRLEALLDAEPTAAEQMRWCAPQLAQEGATPRTWPVNPDAQADILVGAFRSASATPSALPAREEQAMRTAVRQAFLRNWLDLLSMPGARRRWEQRLSYLTDVATEFEKPYREQREPTHAGRRWGADSAATFYRSRYRSPALRASHRLLLANAALRAYRVEHGRYPARLDDLVPGYLKRVPIDPFDLQPLRYRREGSAFLCWSVGPDGKDDGARRIERNGQNSPAKAVTVLDDSIGDIVSP